MSNAVGVKQFRTDIQGMRAVAILSVLIYHAGVPAVSGGYVGVDVFFVISGFLITSHLLGQVSREGRIRLTTFYAKRIRRLLPAALVVLVVTLALARIMLPPLAMRDVSLDGIFTAVYLSNMWFAYTGTDYLANNTPSVFQHYWSLALEEQFYLVWPILIIAVTAISQKRSAVIGLLSAVTLVSFLLGLFLTASNQPIAFFTLPMRAWELGIGGLIAASPHLVRRVSPLTGTALTWCGLAAILICVFVYDDTTAFPGSAAIVPVLGASAILIGGSVAPSSLPSTLLGTKLLQFFGRISYSLYLWHWPILIVPALYQPALAPWLRIVLTGLAIALAVLTERWVERPFRNMGRQKHEPVRSYFAATTATAVAVSLALAAGIMPQLSTDRIADRWPITALPADVPIGSSVPSNIRPALEGATNSNPKIYANGCHLGFAEVTPKECEFGDTESEQTTVLFGDSHAAQWFPALEKIAQADKTRLVPMTKSSCPAAEIATWNSTLQAPYTACDQWRNNALRAIQELQPSTVVISNFPHEAAANSEGDAEAAWISGLERTIQTIPAETHVIVLGDGPAFNIAPTMCLSQHLDNVAACNRQADDVLNQARMRSDQQASDHSGAEFVDTREWYCPAGICSAQRGDIALYRDTHHITVEFSEALVPELRIALDSLKPRQ